MIIMYLSVRQTENNANKWRPSNQFGSNTNTTTNGCGGGTNATTGGLQSSHTKDGGKHVCQYAITTTKPSTASSSTYGDEGKTTRGTVEFNNNEDSKGNDDNDQGRHKNEEEGHHDVELGSSIKKSFVFS